MLRFLVKLKHKYHGGLKYRTEKTSDIEDIRGTRVSDGTEKESDMYVESWSGRSM